MLLDLKREKDQNVAGESYELTTEEGSVVGWVYGKKGDWTFEVHDYQAESKWQCEHSVCGKTKSLGLALEGAQHEYKALLSHRNPSTQLQNSLV